MKKFLLLILFLIGCDSIDYSNQRKCVSINDYLYNTFYIYRLSNKSLGYMRDPRTNLCFAVGWAGDYRGSAIMTTVPCTDEVQRLLLDTSNVCGFEIKADLCDPKQ